MDEVVPGVLQRLRAADIIRAAGLAIASIGQEYSRVGAVRDTSRKGARLSGVVVLSHNQNVTGALSTRLDEHDTPRAVVEVELLDANTWNARCACSPGSTLICSHAAALLYEWLARPAAFSSQGAREQENAVTSSRAQTYGDSAPSKPAHHIASRQTLLTSQGAEPVGDLPDILAQMGLSELRNLAREYDITTANLGKTQLIEAIIAALNQPDVVKKVAASLEKSQRQLLATVILAGGTVTDEDLHGLFERFAFAQTTKLQSVLMALQSKGLLLRASLNSSSQQRIGLSGTLIDIGWYVPLEVRAALRVPLPVTPFDMSRGQDSPEIRQSEPYRLLADLLLVARVLDGYRVEEADEKESRRASYMPLPARPTNGLGATEMTAIPQPGGYPSREIIAALQAALPLAPEFLRYAVRLLRLADILYKDDSGTPYLRSLPNAAQLLLGPERDDIARDLFALWLTQPGYDELFELQEEGLRLCCRTTLTNIPVLRGGELEAENSEARQILLAFIAQVPLNQWIQFPAFARFLYRLNPLFLQKRQRLFPAPHWWIEQEEGRPLQPTQMGDWMRAEGRYLERLMRGPLYWWGMCDLALAPDGRLLAFKLTPLASLLLRDGAFPMRPGQVDASNGQRAGQARAPTEGRTEPPPIEIDENGELLIVSDAASWPFIERIERFAEIAGVGGGRLRYRLTPLALADALGRGHDSADLLSLLRQPGAVRPDVALAQLLTRIEEWIASYGRVRIYTGVSLLEVADLTVKRELSLTTSVDQHIVQSITPTLLILKKPGAEQVVEEMKRRGQSPLLHEEEYDGAE